MQTLITLEPQISVYCPCIGSGGSYLKFNIPKGQKIRRDQEDPVHCSLKGPRTQLSQCGNYYYSWQYPKTHCPGDDCEIHLKNINSVKLDWGQGLARRPCIPMKLAYLNV